VAAEVRLKITIDDQGSLAVERLKSNIGQLKSSIGATSQAVQGNWERVKKTFSTPLGAQLAGHMGGLKSLFETTCLKMMVAWDRVKNAIATGMASATARAKAAFSSLKTSFESGCKSIEKDWGRVKKAFDGPLAGLDKLAQYGKIALVGLGTAGIIAGASFEQAMAKAGSAAGATREEMASMSAVARKMGEDTTYGAKAAADAMVTLASEGFKVPAIRAMTPDIVNLAGALDAELQPAADLTIKTLRQFNLQIKDSGRVVNVLAAANRQGLGSLDQLSGALGTMGTAADAAGLSLEETVALLATMDDRLADPAAAAMGLQAILAAFSEPSKELKAAMEGTTLAADGMAGVLAKVLPHVNNLGDAVTMFDRRSAKAVLSLKDLGAAGFVSLTKQITGTNEAANQYRRMMDTLTGDAKKFKAAIQENMIAVFEAVKPELRETMQAITQGIKDLKPYIVGAAIWTADWVRENKDLILNVIEVTVKVGLLVAVINLVGRTIFNTITIIQAVVSLFNILRTSVGLLITVFRTLAIVAIGPWGLIAAAAAGVFGGLIYLGYRFRDELGGAFEKVGEIAGKVFSWIWDKIMWLFDGIAWLLAKVWPDFEGWWANAKLAVGDFAKGAVEKIKDTGADVINGVKVWVDGIRNGVSNALADIKRLGEAAGGAGVAVAVEAPETLEQSLASRVQPMIPKEYQGGGAEYLADIQAQAAKAEDIQLASAMRVAAGSEEYTQQWLSARESMIDMQLASELAKDGMTASQKASAEIEASAAVAEARKAHGDAVMEHWMQMHQTEMAMIGAVGEAYGATMEKFLMEGKSLDESIQAGMDAMKQTFIRNLIEMTKAYIMQALVRTSAAEAIGKSSAMREKFTAAKLGAVKAFQAFAAVPIIGPILGAAAAVAAFAFLMAFQRGGLVPGMGSGDRIPARLEPGEFVVRKQAVSAVGMDTLTQINRTGRIAPQGGGNILVLQFPVRDMPAEDEFKGEVEEFVVPILEDLFSRRRLRLKRVPA